MDTIARHDFIAAIDAGIVAANLDLRPAAKLAKVGREAKRIGVGTYSSHCKCPLSRAGLTSEHGEPMPRSGLTVEQVEVCAGVFDKRMSFQTRGGYEPGTVFYVRIED